MTPRAGWKQPENGMHPSFFSGTAFYKVTVAVLPG